MSLFFGVPCANMEWRAEDVQAKLRPDWSLDRCQEELEALQGILRAKLFDIGFELLDTMLSPDGRQHAAMPALCPDCIAELALPVPEPRKLAKEIASAKRIVCRAANGKLVEMGRNAHTMERWLAGCIMNPLESPLYFALSSLPEIVAAGTSIRLCDLEGATAVSEAEWRLADGRELQLQQKDETVVYRMVPGTATQLIRRAA